MNSPNRDYEIAYHDEPPGATLRGVLRLASPTAYEEAFASLRRRMELATQFTIDIAEVPFMNSAGIMSLSRLVLMARSEKKSLTCVIAENVPWQIKTIGSLQKLYPQLELRRRRA